MRSFDTFQPGQLLGSVTISLGDSELSNWRSLFPEMSGYEPYVAPGLIISMMMRGYIQILGDRPQGNVHASQELEWFEPAPKGEPLVITLRCLKKELKDGRRWLWLENGVGARDGRAFLKGTMRMLWAA